ncbi:SOS response-associated peptidase [Dyella japonica]|uniref:Abasic site processing protein n=1 Tax=Dyella japonica DSM 16301 TaxID=1440762 RepID=A0A0G9H9X0_9GAMM|nr:SOS response-associated peptidase [Dyella japonica]KLD64492.1 hypothetical protein Y882_07020 [Dyella japonica DSM 16301]
MCGRYALYGPVSLSKRAKEALDRLGLDLVSEVNQRDPQYNIAPTNRAPVIVYGKLGTTVQGLKWGLVPFWSKEPKMTYSTINAKVETVETLRSFRDAFKARRALVPASGYYEWKKTGPGPKDKQPYFIHDPHGDLSLFCGLWESWRDRENPDGERLNTFTIIVGEAGPVSHDIHDRQPVILEPEAWQDWLTGDVETAKQLLADRGHADLVYYPVSKDVGSPANKGADLVERIEL